VQSMSAHLSFDDFMGFSPRPPDVCWTKNWKTNRCCT
jgi:hypothetical protein